MNGTASVWYLQLKTKLLADHAGLSPLLELCNLIGTFSEKVEMLLSPNNNLLIVQEILKIMDVKEAFHLMHSNILDTLEELSRT
jgi:hypothetical protein